MNTKPNNNGEMPAFPIARDMLTLIGVDGMTKRELIAMHLFAALINSNGNTSTHTSTADAAWCVRQADTLLYELKANPPQG